MRYCAAVKVRVALLTLGLMWEGGPAMWRGRAHCNPIRCPALVKKCVIVKCVSIHSISDQEGERVDPRPLVVV